MNTARKWSRWVVKLSTPCMSLRLLVRLVAHLTWTKTKKAPTYGQRFLARGE
jgi:hypothetical protein